MDAANDGVEVARPHSPPPPEQVQDHSFLNNHHGLGGGYLEPEDILILSQDKNARTCKHGGLTVTQRNEITMSAALEQMSFETHIQLGLRNHFQLKEERAMVVAAKDYAETISRNAHVRKMVKHVLKNEHQFVHNPKTYAPPAPPPPPEPKVEPEPETEPEPEPEPEPELPIKRSLQHMRLGFGSSVKRDIAEADAAHLLLDGPKRSSGSATSATSSMRGLRGLRGSHDSQILSPKTSIDMSIRNDSQDGSVWPSIIPQSAMATAGSQDAATAPVQSFPPSSPTPSALTNPTAPREASKLGPGPRHAPPEPLNQQQAGPTARGRQAGLPRYAQPVRTRQPVVREPRAPATAGTPYSGLNLVSIDMGEGMQGMFGSLNLNMAPSNGMRAPAPLLQRGGPDPRTRGRQASGAPYSGRPARTSSLSPSPCLLQQQQQQQGQLNPRPPAVDVARVSGYDTGSAQSPPGGRISPWSPTHYSEDESGPLSHHAQRSGDMGQLGQQQGGYMGASESGAGPSSRLLSVSQVLVAGQSVDSAFGRGGGDGYEAAAGGLSPTALARNLPALTVTRQSGESRSGSAPGSGHNTPKNAYYSPYAGAALEGAESTLRQAGVRLAPLQSTVSDSYYLEDGGGVPSAPQLSVGVRGSEPGVMQGGSSNSGRLTLGHAASEPVGLSVVELVGDGLGAQEGLQGLQGYVPRHLGAPARSLARGEQPQQSYGVDRMTEGVPQVTRLGGGGGSGSLSFTTAQGRGSGIQRALVASGSFTSQRSRADRVAAAATGSGSGVGGPSSGTGTGTAVGAAAAQEAVAVEVGGAGAVFVSLFSGPELGAADVGPPLGAGKGLSAERGERWLKHASSSGFGSSSSNALNALALSIAARAPARDREREMAGAAVTGQRVEGVPLGGARGSPPRDRGGSWHERSNPTAAAAAAVAAATAAVASFTSAQGTSTLEERPSGGSPFVARGSGSFGSNRGSPPRGNSLVQRGPGTGGDYNGLANRRRSSGAGYNSDYMVSRFGDSREASGDGGGYSNEPDLSGAALSGVGSVLVGGRLEALLSIRESSGGSNVAPGESHRNDGGSARGRTLGRQPSNMGQAGSAHTLTMQFSGKFAEKLEVLPPNASTQQMAVAVRSELALQQAAAQQLRNLGRTVSSGRRNSLPSGGSAAVETAVLGAGGQVAQEAMMRRVGAGGPGGPQSGPSILQDVQLECGPGSAGNLLNIGRG